MTHELPLPEDPEILGEDGEEEEEEISQSFDDSNCIEPQRISAEELEMMFM